MLIAAPRGRLYGHGVRRVLRLHQTSSTKRLFEPKRPEVASLRIETPSSRTSLSATTAIDRSSTYESSSPLACVRAWVAR